MAALAGTLAASALPFLLNKLFPGKPGEYKAMPTMIPEQQGLLGQLMGGLGGPLQSGLGNLQSMLSGDASAYEAPAMRQFQQEILPMIAERFSGMGAGAQSSSAFQQALGGAGAGLAENLAMQRAQLQNQGLGQLGSLLGYGLGAQPFQWQQMGGQQGIGEAMAPGFGIGLGEKLPGQLSSTFQTGFGKLGNLLGLSK